MKRLFTLLIISTFITAAASAQVFWTEDFGTGCSRGTVANTYSGANGAWTITEVNPPAAYPNQWFVSAQANNTGVGNCATGCGGGTNRSLHISITDLSATLYALPPDTNCIYFTGLFCASFALCFSADRRAESPVINCSGKSTITLSFIYIEGGEGVIDDATLWYYDGATWAQLDPLAKTVQCNTDWGIWAPFSIQLPASANNNPNVKIGFRWKNDDNGQGLMPSFAVDDITLNSTGGPPTAAFTASDSSGCESVCPIFEDISSGGSSRSWSFPGGIPSTSTLDSVQVCYSTPGTYAVTLISTNSFGSDTVTSINLIKLHPVPVQPVITHTGNCDTLYSSTDSSYVSYQWYYQGFIIAGANTPKYFATQSGVYSIQITDKNGCTSLTACNTCCTVGIDSYADEHAIAAYPNPANDKITLQCSSLRTDEAVTITITNVLGEVIRKESKKWKNDLSLDIKSVEAGIYLLLVENERGQWITKITKE